MADTSAPTPAALGATSSEVLASQAIPSASPLAAGSSSTAVAAEEPSTSTTAVASTSSAASFSADAYPLFPSSGRLIGYGDLVIMQLSRESLVPVVISKGEKSQNRFGAYLHDQLVGVPFGSRVPSASGKGFVYLLRPTPELWTLALPHRTQILYVADIALILQSLSIRPGSVVVEAGTGSGSFSHSVARAIAPHGRLHSFEFHETRAGKAKVEFKEHGMDNLASCTWRNVCKEGFQLEGVADAVFLDLPAPWDAITSAKAALKPDEITRICCFSPCIEQVLRTVTALSTAGFTDISMSECLLRFHEVTTNLPLPPIQAAIANLREQDEKKEDRRQRQMALASGRKRKAGDDGDDDDAADGLGTGTDGGAGAWADLRQQKQQKQPAHKKRGAPVPYGTTLSRPVQEARGHTSYLTFATLLPIGLRGGGDDEGASLAAVSSAVPSEGESAQALKALEAEAAKVAAASAAPASAADDDDMEGFDDGMDEAIGAMSEEDLQRLLSGGGAATAAAP